jgi:hypothetical protein
MRLPWGATLLAPCYQNRVLIPALANAISGQACQWYTALAARVFVYHNDNFPPPEYGMSSNARINIHRSGKCYVATRSSATPTSPEA